MPGIVEMGNASSARSIASVYWMRSLVPIEMKSKCFRKIGSINAAAGTSIIAPQLDIAKGRAVTPQRLASTLDHVERGTISPGWLIMGHQHAHLARAAPQCRMARS